MSLWQDSRMAGNVKNYLFQQEVMDIRSEKIIIIHIGEI